MRKTREILRMKWPLKLSHRVTAKSLGISPGTVGETISRAKKRGLDWNKTTALSDEQLEVLLYGAQASSKEKRPAPDLNWIHRELRRSGVTLELLHLEYLERHPTGYRYTAFCDHYRKWLKHKGLSMRQIHKAGDKMFVDYSGKKPQIIDSKSGEVVEVELFVAVLGASNYTYVEATRTQKSHDWIQSHVHALEYFGGVPALVVPDQLRSGVSSPCRYEPEIQRTYEELGRHYNTAILPARARHPKDKAKVEVAVQIVQRWILACLRNEEFFSLEELNTRIEELLEKLNARPMRDYGNVSRHALFDSLEKAALRPLPSERFVYAQWKYAKVNVDYHVEFEKHYYSVPYQIVGERVEVRISAMTIEVFHRGKRVASHMRRDHPGRHSTLAEHMPKSHRKHREWSPSRLVQWASKIGPNTQTLVEVILKSRPHPEQGYRSVLGLLRLARRYDDERLEAACTRALAAGARSYRNVAAILKNGLDQTPLEQPEEQLELPLGHTNVRGAQYYH